MHFVNLRVGRTVLLALAVAAATSALGSAANTGAGANTQTVAAGAFDRSVRVLGSRGDGSGGLFDIHNNVLYNGNRYHILCLATADHVMRGNSNLIVGFEGGGGVGRFTITPTGLNSGTYTQRGNEDLDFWGIRVDYASLTAAQNNYLDNLGHLNLASVNLNANDVLTSYGYGLSAQYAVDNLNNRVGFIWDNTMGANYDYGTHRNVLDKVRTTVANYNPGYSGGIYTFDSMRWNVSNQAGYGAIFPGDSGGVIMKGNQWVGINTDGAFDTDATNTYWQAKYGYDQGGLQFTAGDVSWLNDNCRSFTPAPEPVTMVLMGGAALAGFLRMRRRKI